MNYIIRPIEMRDAAGVNALRRMPGVLENILGLPSERLQSSEDFIAHLDGNQHQLVAAISQEDGSDLIIGAAGLAIAPNPRLRHSASLGIMIHRDYQNAGVGTAMMSALLDLADNWLMLKRISLTVFADNDRAIHLYEKLGFEKEGLMRLAGVRNGQYVDEYMMARIHP